MPTSLDLKSRRFVIYVALICIILLATWIIFGNTIMSYWLMLWPNELPTYLLGISPQHDSHHTLSDFPLKEWWQPSDSDRQLCISFDASVIQPTVASSIDACESINLDRVTLYINGVKLDVGEEFWSDKYGILRPVESKYRAYGISASNRYKGIVPINFCWHYDIEPGIYFAKLLIKTDGFSRLRYAWAFRILP